jgi:hypothetical protein
VAEKTLTYEIAARFENCSTTTRMIPICYAIPGNGQAPRVDWNERPLVEPGDSVRVTGLVSFRRAIYDYDELICNRRIAKTYVR